MDFHAISETPPLPQRDWALFLDLDGTLLDIAAKPGAVEVSSGLVPCLEAVRAWLGGALAVISGRPLHSIDELLSPLALPVGAEHGAVVRLPDGSLEMPRETLPGGWSERLRAATAEWDGVLIDPKTYSVALHYRLAPERKSDILALAQLLAAENPDFEVVAARMAFELRNKSLNKGAAVQRFMQNAPFAGRMPVFVGDDVTDEDGFAAARELGGFGLHVARAFAGQAANVRAWLADIANAAA